MSDPFGLVAVLGGLLLVIGSFLPWLTIMAPFVGTVSRNGLDGGGDGIWTLVLGVAAMGVGGVRLISPVRAAVQRIPIALGLLGGVVAVADLVRVNGLVADLGKNAFGAAYAGSGLYLLIVGAIVTVIGGAVIKKQKSAQ